jgi:6-phosphofructokinase
MEKYASVGEYLETKLRDYDINARSCKLGHIQRGAATCAFDYKLARIMGAMAVDTALAMKKPEQKEISLIGGRIKAQTIGSLHKILEKYVDLKGDEMQAAKALGIYVGE